MGDFAPIISINMFDVAPADFDRLVARLKEFLRDTKLPGFVKINIFGNTLHTRILVESGWESLESWSRSQWDETVGERLADLIEASDRHEFDLYTHIAP
jgi:hypothetical protein